ncbi:hypothetical protein CPR19088_GLDEOEPO_02035 [Companilactobacillus paralimentarius]
MEISSDSGVRALALTPRTYFEIRVHFTKFKIEV